MSRKKLSRREWASRLGSLATVLLVHGAAGSANNFRIRDRYSPRDRQRPRRPQTRYIVLHTTEGTQEGSLRKIWRRGEAHYFVCTDGLVYRIIHRSKIATHAGRSMWQGHGPVDHYSIGIEVVGFHDREINAAQYDAVRELLRQLKSVYKVPDERVLTHSMVAYGNPNRFHPYNHRGRKRCGMIFARPDVRQRLGLTAKPTSDADVEAGRLRVADLELQRFLFQVQPSTPTAVAAVETPRDGNNIITRDRSAWFIARDQYDSASALYTFPDGRQIRGDEIEDWGRIPTGTQVALLTEEEENEFEGFRVASENQPARAIAGDAFSAGTTIYILPSGMVRTGQEMEHRSSTRQMLDSLPEGTRVLVGYIYGGHVKRNRLPVRIVGSKWNYPSTFYRLPDGRILSGDEIDDSSIPPNTLVFFQS